MSNQKEQLLQALIEDPSDFYITVLDNSMLPDDFRIQEEIHFEIKPPTLEVMAKCALISLKIPEEIREKDINKLKIEDIIEYRKEMAEIIAIFVHGAKIGKFPNWYIDFLVKNTTPQEIYNIYLTASLKLQSSFFLNSFQIANQSNPMMMTKK